MKNRGKSGSCWVKNLPRSLVFSPSSPLALFTVALGTVVPLTFSRFFELNPDYQRLFPEFKDVDPVELENTSALYGHAKRVMKAVENAVTSLDDAFIFAAYLEELGRRHKARALKPSYLDVSVTKM